MFSGGNWQNITYGVSFATSDRVMTKGEWQQHADGEKVLPILRTIPGKVVGPGHNSVVRGPNNRDLFCVYHEWVNNERVLAIDRLDWRGSDMILLGPTTETEAGPFRPKQIRVSERDDSRRTLRALSRVTLGSDSMLLEFWVNLRLDDSIDLALEASDGSRVFEQRLETSAALLPDVWHRVRLETDFRTVSLHVGDTILRESATLRDCAAQLHLTPTGSPSCTDLELTAGWEDRFDSPDKGSLSLQGWHTLQTNGLTLDGRELVCETRDESISLVKQLGVQGDYEAVINLRLRAEDAGRRSAEVIFGDADNELVFVLLGEDQAELAQLTQGGVVLAAVHLTTLPAAYHQLRVLHIGGEYRIFLDGLLLSAAPCSSGQQLALRVSGGAAFDMVRVTGIASV
jgi:hypothetical protein